MNAFLNLSRPHEGFVVYGPSEAARNRRFRSGSLGIFLDLLLARLTGLKEKLDQSFISLNKEDPSDPANRPVIAEFLSAASWAYALVMELLPHEVACFHGPTSPLRRHYIEPLEEIITKCFTAAHMFGNEDESAVGLRGLLTDFELNGGIDRKTGKSGQGFSLSLMNYHLGYFEATGRHPLAYRKFGELIVEIANLVKGTYPETSFALKDVLKTMLTTYFDSVTSKEKTEMLMTISNIAGFLPDEESEKAA